MGKHRRNSKMNTPNPSRMISHTIKLYPEVVTTTYQASTTPTKEIIQWKKPELDKYINDLIKRGYTVGRQLHFKWGNLGVLMGFKEFNESQTYMLDKHHPDVMLVRRTEANVAPSVLYNDLEVLLYKPQ